MRRKHSEEFRREAVRIALTSGLTRRQVAAKEGKTEIARVTCHQFGSHCLPAAWRRLPSATEQARVQIQ